jgi:hypothetical protein
VLFRFGEFVLASAQEEQHEGDDRKHAGGVGILCGHRRKRGAGTSGGLLILHSRRGAALYLAKTIANGVLLRLNQRGVGWRGIIARRRSRSRPHP